MTENRMPIGNGAKQNAHQTGFAYVFLLIAVAMIGFIASNSVSLGSQMARRDAEFSLLAVGGEFEKALRSYAGVPVGAPNVATATASNGASSNLRGPRTLEDLLKDPRSPNVRRHLRQIYIKNYCCIII